MNYLLQLDKYWPEPWQHFILGMESGAAIGLLVFVGAFLMGKVRF